MSETEKLRAELEAALAENAKLKQSQVAGLKLGVSPKGAIMVLGLRSFPVTFYREEWMKIFSLKDQLIAFAEKNKTQIEANLASPKEAKNSYGKTG